MRSTTDDKPPRRTRGDTHPDADVERDQQPATLDDCRRCALWRNATQAVPGEGPRHAAIVLVGEQPGDAEDRQGRPFVGPAGALMDKALEEAGLVRNEVYVTNAVKHFKWTPRGKRRMHKTPGQREIDACEYWLKQELHRIGARVIVALGATALKAVLDDSHARLQDALGKAIEHGEHLVVATYHPSFALRAPDPATRQRVYATIVDALRSAEKLAHQRKPAGS
ncbi:UdgX family uracil-DNA binding protein [Paraburkholderia strydomiana]|jgi:DNA polymerase|uniref:UdgX family uracil-DNA binding protein n=1 Tax=Paraburkholderia strydomiana TaxID=1245417 RepID=UPI0038B74FE2